MIPKRLNSRFNIVSHFDAAFVTSFDIEKRDKYTNTLDINDLGDIKTLEPSNRPTVFTCEPLNVRYEHLVYSDIAPDYWLIFATHVKQISGADIEMSTDNDGNISSEVRKQLPPRIYQDIAMKIIHMTNNNSNDLFFCRPVGFSAFELAVLAKRSSMMSANLADVKIKSSM